MSELFENICDKVDSLQLRSDIAKIHSSNPESKVVNEVLVVLKNIAKHVNGTKQLLERQKECNNEYNELMKQVEGYVGLIDKLIKTNCDGNEQTDSREYVAKIDKLGEAIEMLNKLKVNQEEGKIAARIEIENEDNPGENDLKSESSYEYDSACKFERPRISRENLISSILMYELDHLSEHDLHTVPKYMLGRITLPQINSFIDKINSAISVKYTLLKKPKSMLSYPEKRIVSLYKAVQVPDMRGKTFITEENLTEALGQKCLDKKSLQLITILRHQKKLFVHIEKTVKYYYMS